MSKYDGQAMLTPRLRFPEFRERGKWEFCPLSKVGKRIKRRNGDTGIERVLTNSAEYGVLDQRDFFDKDIATAGKLDNYYVVDKGDYVYNPRISRKAPVGPISRNNIGQGVMSPLYTVFRLGEAGTEFHEQYFSTNCWHDYLRSVSSKGARHDRMSIGAADFMRMPIPLPDPAEQRKIAACLGSLDDWIEAEARKLAALRRHKSGLMQQLFPRPGQTRPHLRFPEFHNAGEWAVKPFKKLYSSKPNNTLSREQLNYYDGSVRNIHYGDIHTNFSTHFRLRNERVPFVNDDALPETIQPDTLCQPGDIIFADASEDLADVGKCIEIVDLAGEQVLSGSHTLLSRPLGSAIVIGFGGYLFKSRRFRKGIEKEAQGTKVMQISAKRMATVDVCYPSEPAEQHRIADCLASLDARVSAQAEKLAALRRHKRGLMQQLFPSPDEVPGGGE